MTSETTTSTPNWTALQGRLLEGGYEIAECLLTNSASASFKVRILGDRSTQAVINVFAPQAASLDQYRLWQEARDLHHPNISSPLSVGRLDWDGVRYPYLILQKADENLAGVLDQRALTVEECREVLRSVGAGLENLHANGFVHSSLSPEHVLAIGDSIRISSTTIRRINTPLDDGDSEAPYHAPESNGENLTPASDIWCLGATLFEVLTQTKCGDDCRDRAGSLPLPFDWIVERSLEPVPHHRPTLSEVFAILSGVSKRPSEHPPLSAPAIQPLAIANAEDLAEPSALSHPADPLTFEEESAVVTGSLRSAFNPRPFEPAQEKASNGHPPLSSSPQSAESSPRPKLTSPPTPVYSERRLPSSPFAAGKPTESPRVKFLSYAFLAIVLAGGLLWLTRPKPPRPTAVNPNPAAQTQTISPASPSTAATAQPTASHPPATASHPVPAQHAASAGPNVWRVVVFTFSHRKDAETRAKALRTQHPGFNPEVFSPHGKSPFLIVLGGPMSRDEANQLRQKARAAGFPRDAYIQNY